MSRSTVIRNQVLVGDAASLLPTLRPGSVDMVLTSPPYFRLRDYAATGQLGLEGEIEEWVTALRGIAGQLHRALKPTGSFWLNISDTYSTHSRQGAGRKSLILGPERLALALLADGWLLRNKIVWQKANPMPTSVRDRLACTWEALYVFVKQPAYYFELDSIREPHRSRAPAPRRTTTVRRAREHWRGPNAGSSTGLDAIKANGRVGHRLGKNPGDVWRIAASNYRGAHHATFPVALAERAIRAGCPTGGLVLDPFFGAGTTAVAAEQLGRDWLGIELNPDYASQAEARIQRARAGPITNAA